MHRVMKTYGEVELNLHVFLTFAFYGGEKVKIKNNFN